MENTPFGLGGFERPVDECDLLLGEIQPDQSIPSSFLPDISGFSTHHQHKLPTCGANAFAWLQEYLFGGLSMTPRFSWISFKKIDGFPLEDGTDIRSIFKSGTTDGVLQNLIFPDDSTLELYAYSDPSVVTQPMRDSAKTRLVKNYAFQSNPTLNQIKQTIYKNKGVIALIRVGEEMWTAPNGITSWQEKDVLPLRVPKKIISGHFVVLYGYDEKYIYFKNSWGTTWGRSGSGYFDASYLPLIVEIGAGINADNTAPAFERDLMVGSQGEDVIALQKYLIAKGFAIPAGPTGYYGAQTKAAVAHWQALHNITPSIGYFGAKSRAFIKLNS